MTLKQRSGSVPLMTLKQRSGSVLGMTLKQRSGSVAMMASAPTITPQRTEQIDEVSELDQVWNVIVWNDPVTLMSYVVFVLRKLFGHDEATATRLMLQVHHEGKAVVASGTREKCEADVARLHAHGLQATLARD